MDVWHWMSFKSSTEDIISDNVCQKDKRNTAIRVHVIGTSVWVICLKWDNCSYNDDNNDNDDDENHYRHLSFFLSRTGEKHTYRMCKSGVLVLR